MIGEGVVIHSEKCKKIQANLKDSLFVKELAVCVWGTSTLANRSLEGKSRPTTKSDPRPPLTPHKFRVLKGRRCVNFKELCNIKCFSSVKLLSAYIGICLYFILEYNFAF